MPTPPTPVAPGSPAAPRNPIAPGNGGGGGSAGGGSVGGGTGGAPGAAAPGGTRTAGGSTTTPTVGAVPRNVPTSGFRAGRGTASVSYFADLGDLPSASSHLAVVPTVLARLSADSLGTITLRPLMTGRDANSTEAACALVAAAQQNRAWIVAAALATARTTTDGDWLGVSTLRSIGRRSGMSVARFVQGATGRTCYRQLAAIRDEARRSGVGSSPAYVVKGPAGTRVVLAPGSADAVTAAIAAVS